MLQATGPVYVLREELEKCFFGQGQINGLRLQRSVQIREPLHLPKYILFPSFPFGAHPGLGCRRKRSYILVCVIHKFPLNLSLTFCWRTSLVYPFQKASSVSESQSSPLQIPHFSETNSNQSTYQCSVTLSFLQEVFVTVRKHQKWQKALASGIQRIPVTASMDLPSLFIAGHMFYTKPSGLCFITQIQANQSLRVLCGFFPGLHSVNTIFNARALDFSELVENIRFSSPSKYLQTLSAESLGSSDSVTSLN